MNDDERQSEILEDPANNVSSLSHFVEFLRLLERDHANDPEDMWSRDVAEFVAGMALKGRSYDAICRNLRMYFPGDIPKWCDFASILKGGRLRDYDRCAPPANCQQGQESNRVVEQMGSVDSWDGDLYEQAANIKSFEGFRWFIEDFGEYVWWVHLGWEEVSLADFLSELTRLGGALDAYFKECGIPFDEENLTWQHFAHFLLGARARARERALHSPREE